MAGKSSAMIAAMIATTTSSSIRVKPRSLLIIASPGNCNSPRGRPHWDASDDCQRCRVDDGDVVRRAVGRVERAAVRADRDAPRALADVLDAGDLPVLGRVDGDHA